MLVRAAGLEALGPGVGRGRRQDLRLDERGVVVMAASLFPLGRLVATPGALEALALAGVSPAELLARHAADDWSDLDAGDRALNDQAVRQSLRTLSAYDVAGVPTWHFYVITEPDRSATTILLPSED